MRRCRHGETASPDMDLQLAGKTIWLMRLGEVTLDFARACLSEGARVALFETHDERALQDLRAKFGLRLFHRARSCVASNRQEDIQAALRWGGAPLGVVAQLASSDPATAWAVWPGSVLEELADDAALVTIRLLPAEAFDLNIERELRALLADDRRRSAALTPRRLRVSAVAFVTPETGEAGRDESRRLAEPAAHALVLFLLGRGFGQAVVVSPEGFIHLL